MAGGCRFFQDRPPSGGAAALPFLVTIPWPETCKFLNKIGHFCMSRSSIIFPRTARTRSPTYNSTNRVEIITPVQRRRRWTTPEKVPGAPIAHKCQYAVGGTRFRGSAPVPTYIRKNAPASFLLARPRHRQRVGGLGGFGAGIRRCGVRRRRRPSVALNVRPPQ